MAKLHSYILSRKIGNISEHLLFRRELRNFYITLAQGETTLEIKLDKEELRKLHKWLVKATGDHEDVIIE